MIDMSARVETLSLVAHRADAPFPQIERPPQLRPPRSASTLTASPVAYPARAAGLIRIRAMLSSDGGRGLADTNSEAITCLAQTRHRPRVP